MGIWAGRRVRSNSSDQGQPRRENAQAGFRTGINARPRRYPRPSLVLAAVLGVIFATVAPSPAFAVDPPVPLQFACALKSNGLVRYVTSLDDCKKSEDKVTVKPGPVLLCIQPSGSVRKVSSFNKCKSPATQLTIPPTTGTVYFCAKIDTGVLRYVNDPSQCDATELAVEVTPNDAAPSVSSTLPVNGATHIAVNANITVTFSESVTASSSAFTLECPSGTPKAFTVSGSPGSTITLDPTTDLPQGTTCSVKVVAANVSDTDALDPPDHPAADFTFSFTTDSPPAVVTTSPTNGATGVDPGGDIVVTFSEPVNASTGSFIIECPTPGNGQSFTVSGSGTSAVTLDPDADLPAATVCTVTVVAAQVSDVDSGDPPDNPAANTAFSFTTADAAPSVTATSPADGAEHVAVNASVVVTFSEPVTATASSFTLECPSGSPQAFTVSGSPGSSITLNPTNDLPQGTVCSVTVIANQVSDVDSVDPPDSMAANVDFSFTTDAAPAVTTTTPIDGASDVDPAATITVNFTEPVDVTASSFTLSCNNSAQAFQVSGSGTSTITLAPDSDLPSTAGCTVTAVAANISDSDGGDPPDHPAADYVFSFTTKDAAPTVLNTSPADGADHVAVNTNISVTFSESVSATASSFTLECPTGSAQAFTVSGSPGSTITLDPTGNLPEGTVCSVTVVANQISDVDVIDPPDHLAADHTFSFTADAAPAVTTTTPADGATDVDPAASITVNFTEPVDVTASSFTVVCDSVAQIFQVTGTGTNAITLDASPDLPSTASCTVTAVAANISDSDSGDPPDHPAADYVFSFTTRDAAPTVLTTSPADGAVDVSQKANIAVTFSEPVTATGSSFTLECPTGASQAFVVSGSPGSSIMLDPTVDLPNGALCTVTVVANQVSDVDTVDPPDHMAADYVFSFTVATNQAPTDIALSNSSIAENQPSGTTVGTLTTTDPDPVDTASYTLENAGCGGGPFPDNGSFQIGGASNDTLLSAASFNFEVKSSYVVCVRSTDSGSLSFDKQFTVSVTNVNEPPTDITLSNSSINENQAVGTTVGNLAQVGDPDTGETYTFTLLTSGCAGSFPDSSSFQISGAQLQSAVAFNFEVKNSYTVCVRVNDPGSPGLSFEKQFTITVTNVNEPPTDITLTNSTIAENQPAGTTVGTLAQVGDPDAGETYAFAVVTSGCAGSFPDSSSFQIGGAGSNVLQTAASFNFEAKNSYTICVRVSDPGSPNLSFDKQFTITVTNVNEPPTDISLSNSTIDENQAAGTLVGNLSQVGDPDTGETYTFALLTSGCSGSFPDSSSFQLSGTQLQSAVSFNFEVKSSYTICVRVNDPGSPNLSFEKQFTISIGDVNDAPVDGDESVSAVGNTLLEYGSVPSPSTAAKKVVAGNLLANATDEDQPPQTLTVSAGATSAQGGTVSVSSAGAFSYVPPAGFTGTDTFSYTVSDGNGGTNTSTVTVTVASRVWYVNNTATAGGLGRSSDPFDTLAEADTAANATGDTIYVYEGDGTTTGLIGGFNLLASQRLLGEPVSLVVGADTLASGIPANRPSMTGTVALASGSRVEGLDIAGTGGAAIAGTNTGGSTVTNVNLSGPAGGVALTGAAAGTFSFTNFTINTTGLTGFLVNTTGAPTISVGSGSTENVSATGGPAVDVRNVNGASTLTFDAVSSTNSASTGINLDSIGAATFTATSGAISGAAGNAVDINGGSGNITYPGTLGNGAGNTADITGRTGGAIALSGNINDTNDAAGGITMSGNTGGSTTFSGATKTLNTGASAAFSSTGSGQVITFSGGGLDIDTTSGAGFSATGGGTFNVTTGTNPNTIDTTTGTALNIAPIGVTNTTIGASGLTFRSIAANGAANGIVLTNTGATGSLAVTGLGTSTAQGGDFSGGTIQATTGDGISLTNTTSPSFRNMRLLNTGNNGVNGTQVSGFSFTDGTITGAGDASDENSITFDDSLTATPNLTGAVTITNNVISQTEAEGVDIENWAGTITDANISNNALSDTGDVATPGSAITLIGSGLAASAANITKATVANNTITDFRAGVGIQVRAGNPTLGGPTGSAGTAGSATNIINVTGNLMNGGNGGIGNQPDRFFTGGVSGNGGQGNFNVSNNGTAANRLQHIDCIAIEVQMDGPVTMTSTVQNNFINANSAVGCAGIAVGTDDPNNLGAGTHSTVISGNNVMGTDGPGIFPIVRASGSTMFARVLNNTVAAPITTNAARAGIRVDSGSATGDTTMCLEISGNTTAGSTNTATATTSPGINLRKQGTDPAINTFGIEGMAATASPGVENYVNGLNTSTSGTFGTGGTALLSAQSGFTNCNAP
ncbi:Ig-like domain-containing protein [Monashia sp. NPDC004114]